MAQVNNFADFFRALMNQPNVGGTASPFTQLVSDGIGQPQPMQQQFAQTDNISPLEQYLAHQRMLQRRGEATIQTIDPGRTWNGYDKNAIMPDDVMISNFWRSSRQSDI